MTCEMRAWIFPSSASAVSGKKRNVAAMMAIRWCIASWTGSRMADHALSCEDIVSITPGFDMQLWTERKEPEGEEAGDDGREGDAEGKEEPAEAEPGGAEAGV